MHVFSVEEDFEHHVYSSVNKAKKVLAKPKANAGDDTRDGSECGKIINVVLVRSASPTLQLGKGTSPLYTVQYACLYPIHVYSQKSHIYIQIHNMNHQYLLY